jgi:cellulose synthase/poly-beta-1,6-N-acetylglucosamine synthase-like glycosyltransferase
MKVSVIIPIYNGERDLLDLIPCLEAQTYGGESGIGTADARGQIEYLLVDNNSCDQTAELLQQAAAQTKIQIIPLTEARVQSSYAARNLGIRQAKGDILAFTDADCRPQPDWVAELIKPFDRAEVGLVAGEIIGLSGTTILEKYAEKYGVLSAKFALTHPFCPYGQTANLAIRKEALTKVGLFRPHLNTGGDADICWRILRTTNWQLEFAPKAVIAHRHRDNLADFRSQWHRYGRSNRYLHELHGVELRQDVAPQAVVYSLCRWLLKDLPRNTAKMLLGKADYLDAIKTPIDLIATTARSQGQKAVRLSEAAREIEWL